MSKRIILSDRELHVIDLCVRGTIKEDDYHIKSVVGKLGHEEMLTLLKRLGLGVTDVVKADSEAKGGASNPPKVKK